MQVERKPFQIILTLFDIINFETLKVVDKNGRIR
jgi:hypothetical protein